jgi:hypothetical protein
VLQLFHATPGIADCLSGEQIAAAGMTHARTGEVVLVSEPNSWQAYYWWLNDDRAPAYARTVDIHRKPGYDPVELFFDPATRSIPLRAEMIKGSHGVVVPGEDEGVVLSSAQLPQRIADTAVKDWVLSLMS